MALEKSGKIGGIFSGTLWPSCVWWDWQIYFSQPCWSKFCHI